MVSNALHLSMSLLYYTLTPSNLSFYPSLCLQAVHAAAGLIPPTSPSKMGPTGGSASAPPPLQSPHMRTEHLLSGNSAPNSPMAMLNIGSSHENEVVARVSG